jgi:hypothetical protein
VSRKTSEPSTFDVKMADLPLRPYRVNVTRVPSGENCGYAISWEPDTTSCGSPVPSAFAIQMPLVGDRVVVTEHHRRRIR